MAAGGGFDDDGDVGGDNVMVAVAAGRGGCSVGDKVKGITQANNLLLWCWISPCDLSRYIIILYKHNIAKSSYQTFNNSDR